MIIDRALYLRRSVRRKLLFHLISVTVIHIWLFNYMNSFNEASSWPPLLFYFIKCIYFLFSAYQIRCGYPNRISGNFATSGFTTINCRIFELYVENSIFFCTCTESSSIILLNKFAVFISFRFYQNHEHF